MPAQVAWLRLECLIERDLGEDMQSVKQVCRLYAGNGTVGQNLCSSCGGTGTVTVLLPTGTCPRCKGTGRVPSIQPRNGADDCETCLGTGWVGTRLVAG